jgi:hypothetical protein
MFIGRLVDGNTSTELSPILACFVWFSVACCGGPTASVDRRNRRQLGHQIDIRTNARVPFLQTQTASFLDLSWVFCFKSLDSSGHGTCANQRFVHLHQCIEFPSTLRGGRGYALPRQQCHSTVSDLVIHMQHWDFNSLSLSFRFRSEFPALHWTWLDCVKKPFSFA